MERLPALLLMAIESLSRMVMEETKILPVLDEGSSLCGVEKNKALVLTGLGPISAPSCGLGSYWPSK